MREWAGHYRKSSFGLWIGLKKRHTSRGAPADHLRGGRSLVHPCCTQEPHGGSRVEIIEAFLSGQLEKGFGSLVLEFLNGSGFLADSEQN